MAWHIARLGRVAAEDFPELDVMTGQRSPRQAQAMSPDIMAHNFKLWKAALNRVGDRPAASPATPAADTVSPPSSQ